MNGKYCCRICWNTQGWTRPTGDAKLHESALTYASKKGFGHEEWLFNFGWLITSPNDSSTYRYSFLQPIAKYRKKYEKQELDILLYTVDPTGNRLAVGRIRKCYVPDRDESMYAVRTMKRQGWLASMKCDIRAVGGDPATLDTEPPEGIISIRFRPGDVSCYSPYLLLPPGHKAYLINRYQPIHWDGNVTAAPLPVPARPHLPNQQPNLRSEEQRLRAAVEGTTIDPHHNRMQNQLYNYLVGQYGPTNVCYEHSFVDLEFQHQGVTVYIEIKTQRTAKQCVREALGQLIEYCYYPCTNRANRLLIVGDASTTSEDEQYLRHLRDSLHLAIWYAEWNWENNSLGAWK